VDFTGACARPSVTPGDHGCNYRTVVSVPTAVGTITVERGFVAVDAEVEGNAYRFANTHLEVKYADPPAALVQVDQAAELIGVLQATTPGDRTLLVVGDINSSPVDPSVLYYPTPYMQFLAAGFTDAWTLRPGKVPGFSCCQSADLSNHNTILSERIDMLFALVVPTKVKQARVVGATVSDKTPPPGVPTALWPSDHGAVIADLQF